MKKVTLLVAALFMVGATYACDGDSKKACCKKDAKKECCAKGGDKKCKKDSKECNHHAKKDEKATDKKA